MNNENLNNNLGVNQIQTNNFNNVNSQSNTLEQPKQNNKSKKNGIIIGVVVGIIVLVIIALGLIIGLGKNSSGPDKVVKNYINSLINKDYDKAFGYVYLPENSFVDSDDYFEYIKVQKYFSTMSSQKIGSIEETYTRDTESEYRLTLKDQNNVETYYKVQLQKDYKNEWKIVESNLYISNWSVIIPGDTEFYIDNKKVDTSLITETVGIKDKFVLPAIASTKKTFKIVNSLQSKEVEFTALSSNDGQDMYLELTDRVLINKAYEYIKNTWNNMYTDYINGVDVSDVAKKYFVDTMNIENVSSYYTKSFDDLTRGSSGYKYINYVLTEVVDRPETDNYVISGNTITLNFGYKLTWNWSFNNDFRTMTNFSKIRLRVDGESFKIYEVADENLFKYSSHFTSKY